MRLAELAGIADDVFELEKKVGKYCLNVEPLWKILYLRVSRCITTPAKDKY